MAEDDVDMALRKVTERVAHAASEASRAVPRLVAVSKFKSASEVRQAYEHGQRHFGENYVQELCAKSSELPDDVQWHMIGNLQSNKAKMLLEGVPRLYAVESVHSAKIADMLDKATNQVLEEGRRTSPLNVFVQVNSSGEDSKSGCEPSDAADLAQHIRDHCSHLKLLGLMTIGMPDYSPNPVCFERMVDCRRQVAKTLGVAEDDLELSMGMSADFENAIGMGSTNVRVGSQIFGSRPEKKPAHQK